MKQLLKSAAIIGLVAGLCAPALWATPPFVYLAATMSGDLTGNVLSPVVAKVNATACDAGFTLGPNGCYWSQTASASASLNFTGLTGSNYELRCSALLPATNAVNLYLQFGEGGTPTWETAAYQWAAAYAEVGATGSAAGSTSDSGFKLVDNVANANSGATATVELQGLSAAVQHAAIWRAFKKSSAGGAYYQFSGGGTYPTDTNAITALRVQFSSGNITSGTCNLYPKSGA